MRILDDVVYNISCSIVCLRAPSSLRSVEISSNERVPACNIYNFIQLFMRTFFLVMA